MRPRWTPIPSDASTFYQQDALPVSAEQRLPDDEAIARFMKTVDSR